MHWGKDMVCDEALSDEVADARHPDSARHTMLFEGKDYGGTQSPVHYSEPRGLLPSRIDC